MKSPWIFQVFKCTIFKLQTGKPFLYVPGMLQHPPPPQKKKKNTHSYIPLEYTRFN